MRRPQRPTSSSDIADRPDELPLGRAQRGDAGIVPGGRAGDEFTDLPILITGESGTGKSLIAQTLFMRCLDRRSMPFVTAEEADLIELEGPLRG